LYQLYQVIFISKSGDGVIIYFLPFVFDLCYHDWQKRFCKAEAEQSLEVYFTNKCIWGPKRRDFTEISPGPM